jgi:hypothetical protein
MSTDQLRNLIGLDRQRGSETLTPQGQLETSANQKTIRENPRASVVDWFSSVSCSEIARVFIPPLRPW